MSQMISHFRTVKLHFLTKFMRTPNCSSESTMLYILKLYVKILIQCFLMIIIKMNSSKLNESKLNNSQIDYTELDIGKIREFMYFFIK